MAVTITEFQQQFYEVEGLRLNIPSKAGELIDVGYAELYTTRLGDDKRVKHATQRLVKALPGRNWFIVDGFGRNRHHNNTFLKTLRDTYRT